MTPFSDLIQFLNHPKPQNNDDEIQNVRTRIASEQQHYLSEGVSRLVIGDEDEDDLGDLVICNTSWTLTDLDIWCMETHQKLQKHTVDSLDADSQYLLVRSIRQNAKLYAAANTAECDWAAFLPPKIRERFRHILGLDATNLDDAAFGLCFFPVFEVIYRNLFMIVNKNEDRENEAPFLSNIINDPRIVKKVGKGLSLIIDGLIGSPRGLNLRNLLWHSFAFASNSMLCIDPSLISFSGLILALLCSTLKEDLGDFNFITLDLNLNLQMPELTEVVFVDNQSVEDAEILCHSSVAVIPGHEHIYQRAFEFYRMGRYTESVALFSALFEGSLRRIYLFFEQEHEQEMNQNHLASNTELYVSFDDMIATYRSMSRPFCGMPQYLVEYFFDIFIRDDGPRIRDRLAHGEASEIKKEIADCVVEFALLFLQEYRFDYHVNVHVPQRFLPILRDGYFRMENVISRQILAVERESSEEMCGLERLKESLDEMGLGLPADVQLRRDIGVDLDLAECSDRFSHLQSEIPVPRKPKFLYSGDMTIPTIIRRIPDRLLAFVKCVVGSIVEVHDLVLRREASSRKRKGLVKDANVYSIRLHILIKCVLRFCYAAASVCLLENDFSYGDDVVLGTALKIENSLDRLASLVSNRKLNQDNYDSTISSIVLASRKWNI